MYAYNTRAHQSIAHLEQALECVLSVARAHEPAEATTPARPKDVPYGWGEVIDVLEAVERKQPLWADLMRTAVVLRQTQVSYALAHVDEKPRPPSRSAET
jgi:hypothetical protein